MITLTALSVLAILVAPPTGPEDGCPSARQVTEAMQARSPTYLIPPDGGGRAEVLRTDVLRATLDIAGDGTVVRFSLVDARGEIQLRRTMPAPGRSRAVADCVALADTIAAIVERYLGTITYDADTGLPSLPPAVDEPTSPLAPNPPSSAPPPLLESRRGLLALAGVGWRMTTGTEGPKDQSGPEGRVGLQLDLTRRSPRLAVQVLAGAAPSLSFTEDEALRQARFRRFPLRAGVLLALPAGPGWVEPSVHTGADLLFLTSPGLQDLVRLAPVLEGGVAYRIRIGGPFHLRPNLVIGVPMKVYGFLVRRRPGASEDESVQFLATPRAYASFGIDVAVVFR